MPRLRTIKPGFFRNEVLAQTGLAGRVLFSGLWCWADREGRIEDRPIRIKADIFPYDDGIDVDALLNELACRGFIIRYSANGTRYIQIQNFTKHQTPHYKEVASEIPPPLGHVDSPVVTYGPTTEQRERIMERDGRKCALCDSTERLTIDHIVPRSRGGSGDDDNLRVLCNRCNTAKGNREAKATADEHRGDIASNSPQTRLNESDASPTVFGIPSLGSGILDLGSEKVSTSADVDHPDLCNQGAAARETLTATTADQAEIYVKKISLFVRSVDSGMSIENVPEHLRDAVRETIAARVPANGTTAGPPANGDGAPATKPRSAAQQLVADYWEQVLNLPCANWGKEGKAAKWLLEHGYAAEDICAAGKQEADQPFWRDKGTAPELTHFQKAPGQAAIQKAKQRRLKAEKDARAEAILAGAASGDFDD